MYTRSVLLAASFAALAAADSCLPTSAFSLTTSEGGLGQIYDGQVRTGLSLGQIYDGQVRTGNDTSCLTLVASSNGTLSDITGRPCYVTPYHQFECTAALQDNATPYGFCVESGLLTYEGNSTFYACDTGVDDQANIYVEEISAPACTPINLIVGSENCGTCTASTVVSTVVSTVAATVTETTAETVTVSGAGETVTVSGAGETVTVAETETSEVTVTAVGSTVVTPSTVYATVTATATATVTKTEYDTAITTAIAATTVVEESTVVAPTTVVEESTVVAPTTVVEESTVVAPTTVVEESTVVAPTTVVEESTVVAPTTVVEESTVVAPTTVVEESTVVAPTTVVEESTVVAPTTVVEESTVVAPTTATAVVTTTSTPTTLSSSTTTEVSSSASSVCTPSTSIYPNLIVPINSETPDTALGTGYWANITKSDSEEQDVLLEFDISSEYTGTCELKFMFPDDIITFPFVLEGDTSVEVYELTSQVTESDTWNDHPATGDLLATVDLVRGGYAYSPTFKCNAGSYNAYLLKCTGDCVVEYFIDYNPPPVGTVITPCA